MSKKTLLLLLLIFSLSCMEKPTPIDIDSLNNPPTYETGTMTDQDGNVYKTVKIGNQWWMAENLKVTHYRNGESIPNVTDNTEWTNLSTGAYCNYDNNYSNVATYGRLYNWYAVNDGRKITPAGWHVPTDEEWKELEMYLGMNQSEADNEGWRGTDEGGKLKETGTTHWNNPNTGATNESGFSAIPGGVRNEFGSFGSIGGGACFWTSTNSHSDLIWRRYLHSSFSGVNRIDYEKRLGFSVRCVKNIDSMNMPPTASFTISPLSGNTLTIFNFDASSSNDLEDVSTSLQVRWDWENDGSWDTGYSTIKTVGHQYSSEGAKTVKLEVKDSGGLLNTTTKQISVSNGGGQQTGTLTDQDGNVYQAIKIGAQWWMAENLKVTHYRNGDPIPNVTGNTEWTNLSTGAWCAYNNDNGNVSTYGLLYNWYAIVDSRNIAPDGWHVPTDEEYTALKDYLIANGYNWDGSTSGDKTGKSLASKTGWNSSSESGDVGNDMSTNNASGFSAFPGGYRYGYGAFLDIGGYGYWWSSTAYTSSSAWYCLLGYGYSDFGRYYGYKQSGFSVRLVMD